MFSPLKTICDIAIAENVCYRYPNQNKYAVGKLSHTFKKGEVVTIWGASGSGKSTLLKLLMGFIHPSEGGIIHQSNDNWGYFPQSPQLFNLTLRQNFELVNKNITSERIYDLLTKVGMEEDVKAKGSGLELMIKNAESMFSGGQHRRLCLAVFLASEAQTMLFDEPTASLDIENSKIIAYILINLKNKKNRNIIIASHDETLRLISDNILTMEHGVVIYC